jgi:hypothetical protein
MVQDGVKVRYYRDDFAPPLDSRPKRKERYVTGDAEAVLVAGTYLVNKHVGYGVQDLADGK